MEQERIFSLIRALTAPAGVSGREDGAFRAAERLLKPLGDVRGTPLGSLICTVNEGEPGAPHLLLEAHLDRIGLVVTRVEEDGFLRFSAVGSVDPRWLPAAPVVIRTRGGDRPGVISPAPPHPAGNKSGGEIRTEDLFIDTGCSGADAKNLFHAGDTAVFRYPAVSLAGDRITGPGLDDRAGCAAVLTAAGTIAGERPKTRVTVLLSSMEETGGQGSGTGVFSVMPDAAVAVDVSFAEGFGVGPDEGGALGKGPLLGTAPILDRALGARLEALAEKHGLPLQKEVMGGRTGTDADLMASAGAGVRTALLSVPLRSMHTAAETADAGDIRRTARLMALLAEEGF